MTTNVTVNKWLEEMKALLTPDKIEWITGDEAQLEALREEACRTGEMLKLNEEKLPDCYLHRTKPNDVARVEDRTFICTSVKEDAGPTNNWCAPTEMYKKLYDIARGTYAALESTFLYKRLPVVPGEAERLGEEIGASMKKILP